MAHERRERFAARFPQHVTMRVCGGVGRIRRGNALAVLKKAILLGGRRPDLRVVHFNLLSNHLHLIVEAPSAEGLARGMQGFAVRLARGFNRVLGRKGKLFKERYHSRSLRTPREVRSAMAYVLLNARHHAADGRVRLSARWVDPYS